MVRSLFRNSFKTIVDPVLKWQYSNYSKKDHLVKFKGLDIIVIAGVFHPGLFLSTKVLVEFMNQFDLTNKKVLELGCGTGAFSCWAATQGAISLASDINPTAVENARINAKKNNIAIECIESDLFTNLEKNTFDFVVINPPYYPKKPLSDADKAWYCGEEFEYFHKLFNQLKMVHQRSQVFMVLSEDCDVKSISEIAKNNGIPFNSVYQKKYWIESNNVYALSVHQKN